MTPSMRKGRKRGKNKIYQPSGARGTRSPHAMPHRLQNPKWLLGGHKIAAGVRKGLSTLGFFRRSRQLSLNKFFDRSTPSMIMKKMEEKMFKGATNVVAS